MWGMSEQDLIGRTIRSAYVHDGGNQFSIDFVDGTTATWQVEGDCCSHSWIEETSGLEGITGETLLEIDHAHPSSLTPKDDEWGSAWQDFTTSFRTDRSVFTVECRNESNGYYSGWLERIS